eukprot:12262416-Ditylum_brightwellii.AAC.1
MDHPRQAAQYIVDNNKPQSRNPERDCVLSWAKKRLRYLEQAICQIAQLYDFYLDENKQKKVKGPGTTVYKYGAEVPSRNVQDALQLDKKKKNTMWQDTMALEIKALSKMDC